MGAGRSQSAAYELVADVPAGTWTLVADGIITDSVDVTFEILWRKASGTDVPIVTWQQHFDPLGGGNYDATPYEVTGDGPAITYAAGDQLVFRYTGDGTTTQMAYIPDGDGALANGRIPYIDLPQ
ncbi:MAG: hypothetical protein H6709_08440 [Kofleriaceae bacterium]|nr:hypothetical protein [Kofleriaceae bacterium]MCB9572105.1 hypothetical protein [Kofleriaceae bacterium]